MKSKHLLSLITIFLVCFVIGCGPTEECPYPYILDGEDCCLDENENYVCDYEELLSPFEDEVNGDTTHIYSGISFPESVGELQRGRTTTYDEDGLDVSVAYNSEITTLTMYVYSPELDYWQEYDTAEDHFVSAVSAIFAGGLLEEPEIILDSNLTDPQGYFARVMGSTTYEDDLVIDKLSDVYLWESGEWIVKLRITYPLVFVEEANEEIGIFLDELVFPVIG